MESSVDTSKDKLVRDVMKHGIPTVQEESSFAEVVKVFKLNDARIVVVVDEFDEASGLITEMDMLEHYRRAESLPLTAEEIMEERVFTCSPVTRLGDAAAMMLERNIEHLIIVHGEGAAKLGQANRPVALLSASNIVHQMAEDLAE